MFKCGFQYGKFSHILKNCSIAAVQYYINYRCTRQIDAETEETVTDFISLELKITADADCSYEIKRHLLLGRKTMTNLDSI